MITMEIKLQNLITLPQNKAIIVFHVYMEPLNMNTVSCYSLFYWILSFREEESQICTHGF